MTIIATYIIIKLYKVKQKIKETVMEAQEYLLNHKNDGTRISSIIRYGRIDLLQQELPTAEDLVKKVEDCKSYSFDIMEQIALNGDTQTLIKILDTYFRENTAQNQDLKQRFLLSKQYNGRSKDYHYFSSFLSPQEKLIAAQELELSNTSIEPDNRSELDKKKSELYKLIRDEYQSATILQKVEEPQKTQRLGVAPKGTPASEFIGFVGNAEEGTGAIFRNYTETYPNISLHKYSKNHNSQEYKQGLGEVIDLSKIPYKPREQSLSQQAFRKMHFPDLYFGNNYFSTLNNIDRTYQNIKNHDPIASASIKNFIENGGHIIIENTREPNHNGNLKEGIDYGGYSNGKNIAIRADNNYGSHQATTLYHELAHNTDSDFNNTDAYQFATTLMSYKPEHSPARNHAINRSLTSYPSSQLYSESLARIAEQYPASNLKDDALAEATYQLFSQYGEARLNDDKGILNRIKISMRLRLGNYKSMEEVSKALKIRNATQNHYEGIADGYYVSKIDQPPKTTKEQVFEASKKFDSLAKGLVNGRYKIVGGQDMSYTIAEDTLIKAIKDEINHINKIKKTPNASSIALHIDALSRDNITNDTPIEAELAQTFNRTNKIYTSISKTRNIDVIEKSLNQHTNGALDALDNLKEDEKSGFGLDRSLCRDCVSSTTKALLFAKRLSSHYFPNANVSKDISAERTIPYSAFTQSGAKESINEIENLQKNIALTKDGNEDISLPVAIVNNPYMDYSSIITTADKNFARRDIEENIEDLGQRLNSGANQRFLLQKIRSAQNIYKELNPTATRLPEDLRFSNLKPEDFAQIDSQTPSPIIQRLNSYAQKFETSYNAQQIPNQKGAPSITR